MTRDMWEEDIIYLIMIIHDKLNLQIFYKLNRNGGWGKAIGFGRLLSWAGLNATVLSGNAIRAHFF